jgi:hypothetical protein
MPFFLGIYLLHNSPGDLYFLAVGFWAVFGACFLGVPFVFGGCLPYDLGVKTNKKQLVLIFFCLCDYMAQHKKSPN